MVACGDGGGGGGAVMLRGMESELACLCVCVLACVRVCCERSAKEDARE